jgi:UDP-N-acetylglucosamine transferase subunit ALG13
VIVACNSKQKAVLSREINGIQFTDIFGYNIRYGESAFTTICLIVIQIPKILIRIKRETRWLKMFISQNNPDLIISDNRFGFFSKNVPSIFITHQLFINTGTGNWINRLVTKWNYSRIQKFKTCWIPDNKDNMGLGGSLSHPAKMPATHVKYIGNLSRLQNCGDDIAKRTDILIILSGPEPQRSLLEEKLLSGLKTYAGNAVLIRGLPGKNSEINSSPNISVLNYVSGEELNRLICSSDLIISRCGYTTVMDIVKLGKRSVLIPTPGQAEQEYLAGYLHKKGIAFTMSQGNFHLQQAIEAVSKFSFTRNALDYDLHKEIIKHELDLLSE